MGRPQWAEGLTSYFVFVLLSSTLGPFLFGYHLAELNAPQAAITCQKQFLPLIYANPKLPKCIPMVQLEIGLVNSIFTLGGLVGALAAGPAATRLGRMSTIRYNTVLFVLGPIAEALAVNVPLLALGRFVSGLGAGVALVATPIYISEIAPPSMKGFFGSFTQVMTNFGILTTQLLGLFLSRGQLWRVILGVGGVIGLVQAMTLPGAVESPKWQVEHGSIDEAKEALQKLRGSGFDIREEVEGWKLGSANFRRGEERALLDDDPSEVQSQDGESLSPKQDRASTVGVLEVILHPEHRKATWVVMVVMIAQQFCGINSIVFYGVTLLSDILTTSSGLLNVFLALLNLLVTLGCAPLIDYAGRKPCLLTSTIGMGASSLLLGIAILSHIPALSIVAVLIFVASFGLGLGPIPFMLASELLGPQAAGATQSWALAANWAATFVVAQFFPVINQALGKGKVYFLFAALAAGFALFIALFVPETKGKRDADEVWGRSKHSSRPEHHPD